ncbi:MAG: tRNA pseudouridine(54/55) synthase Pus10 [Candidatus Micrarchaeia archaeon]
MALCRLCASLWRERGNAAEKKCGLCAGRVWSPALKLAEEAIKRLRELEWSSFQTASSLPDEVLAREEAISEVKGLQKTPLKSLLNRLAAEKIIAAFPGARADVEEPAVKVLLDLFQGRALVEPQPLFIAGRYNKLSRGIAQSRWDCSCRGRGCARCGGTGKMYASVEELVGGVLKKVFAAKGMKFHASGREDVDARMLGTGRPFAVELVRPSRRKAEEGALELLINSSTEDVKVRELRFVGKKFVEALHNARLDKKYRALVEVEDAQHAAALLSSLRFPLRLSQLTPTRVLHRRADRERKRKVYSISAREVGERLLELEVAAEAGTYVKEFVTGDGGRTTPSISGLLGREARVLELDVTDVERVIEDWW